MPEVIFKRAAYDYETLKPAITEVIDTIGENLSWNKSNVLIKPNLLLPARPEKAVLTHPLIIRAVVEYVRDRGGRPKIMDSPGTGSIEKIYRHGGYQEALKDLDVEFSKFSDSMPYDIGEPFGIIDMAEDPLKADIVINLAKLKTHSQMFLSLGVKNLFGCIVGLKKPEWHFRTGVDREMFARLLLQIYMAVNPAITIVDGILAMEGPGPGKSGIPRHIGVLVGSRNAVSTDIAICKMLNISPNRLPTNKAAGKIESIDHSVKISGDFFTVDNFSFPEIAQLSMGPEFLNRLTRRYVIQKPVVNPALCELCGECWQYCPAKAITCDNKTIHFNYDICIRCYCCIEICPHAALSAVETLPGMLVRRLFSLDS